MEQQWKIASRRNLFYIPLVELLTYRYLLQQFIKKDLQLYYRQTYLGPLWFLIQPVLNTLVFTFVFARMARISTDATPPILFYLCSLSVWNYFSECFSKTCTILRDNAATFKKLYFPRLIIPLSIIISNLVKFGIQLLLFVVALVIFLGMGYRPNITIAVLLTPLLLLLMGCLGLGMGLIVSSLTVKYRDLAFLVTFGTQLLMFLTPVIYPLSSVPPNSKLFIVLNPITSIVETFRFAFLGTGQLNPGALAYSGSCILIMLCIGLLLYHKVERNFIDLI